MSQQINLFNPLFLKQKKYFSALMMLQSIVVLLVGLAIFHSFVIRQEGMIERQVAAAVSENALQSERLSKFSGELSTGATQKQTEAELQKTLAAIAARESLLRQMQSGPSGDAAGYSEYLRVFARQIVGGVWLTSVDIEENTQDLTLKGNALQADLIGTFIRRLSSEPLLHGRSFASLSVSRSVSATGGKSAVAAPYVAFRLSSSELPAGAEPDSESGRAAQ